MAFVPQDLAQQDKNQPGAINPLSMQAPIATSSAPGAGPAPGNQPAGSPTNTGPAQPFTNLQAYLTANEPQIEGMGQNVAGKLGQQYGQVQTDVGGGQKSFEGDIASGYTAPNADVVANATASPSSFVQDPNNVTAFQKQLNDSYTGPTNFEGSTYYQNLNKEVQNAASNADLVNSPSGLGTYLKSIETNPTEGENTLDTVLLSGSPTAYGNVKNAASQFKSLPDYLSGVVTSEDKGVQDAVTAAQGASTAATKGLNTAQDTLSKRVQDELTGAQGSYTTYNKDVGSIRSSAQDINKAIQDYLAANPQLTVTGGNDYLAPWLNLGEATNAPSAANVAGQGDYSDAAALAMLAGSTVPLNLPISGATADQAGKFALPMDLEAAIANKDVPAAMTKEVQSLSDQIGSAYKPYQDLMNKEAVRADLRAQIDVADQTISGFQQKQTLGHQLTPDEQAQLSDAMTQRQTILDQANKAGVGGDLYGSYKAQIEQMAQGLQWLPGASSGYNDLVSRLQADLTGLSGMNLPNYSPAKAPGLSPQEAAKVGSAAGTAIGTGAPIAAGIGGGAALAGSQAASAADLAAAMGTTPAEAAAIAAEEGGEASALGTGLGAGLSTIPAAGLAAYGASNIIQNTAADPMKSGLEMLGNTGLALATLSLPPKILKSIGNELQNVINSIGDFFKGLF